MLESRQVSTKQFGRTEQNLLADDGVLKHHGEVSTGDNIPVASRGHEDIGARGSIFHGGDLITSHRSLESVDGVNLGDENASTIRAERLGALASRLVQPISGKESDATYTLADITVAGNNGDLTGKHNVGGTLDTIDKGLAAAVVVVELALSNTVVDVDGGDLELALAESLVEVMDAGCGLFGDTLDILEVLRELLVDHRGEIATIVENHVEALAIGESSKGLFDAPEVLFLGLTLPGVDGNASSGDRSSGVVLRGEDVLKVGGWVRLCHRITFTAQKLTQDDQVTSAPREVRVSMRTAV